MTTSDNPYTSQSISSYNASPPADDGSQVDSNKLEWAKHKTKLADPIKTLAEAINTQLITQGALLINTATGVRNQMSGALAFAISTATIGATGAVVLNPEFSSNIEASSAGGATATSFAHMSATNAYAGTRVTIHPHLSATEEVTIHHATDSAATATDPNVYMADDANFTLDDVSKSITFEMRQIGTATEWHEVARSGAGAASQTEMEAAASVSKFVTPGRQHFHPGVVKFAVKFEGTSGSANIQGTAYNTTGVADNSAGDYTVTIGTDFSDADWVAHGMPQHTTGAVVVVDGASQATGTLKVQVYNTTPSAIDVAQVHVSGIGDQA